MYSPLLVQPMREELTSIGFQELRTAEDVDAFMEELQKLVEKRLADLERNVISLGDAPNVNSRSATTKTIGTSGEMIRISTMTPRSVSVQPGSAPIFT